MYKENSRFLKKIYFQKGRWIMVHNYFIKCQVCGAITRIRLQVGFLEHHPINVACGRCRTSLDGNVLIGQQTPGLKYCFKNADEVQGDNSDYVVECSGEFPTLKPHIDDMNKRMRLTPFLRFSMHDGFEEFKSIISKLNILQKHWAQYKRIIDLYELGNHEHLLNEIWKVLPKKQFQCRDEFEISRAIHMIEVIYFIGTLRKDVISNLSLSNSILKLPPTQVDSLIDFLNSHAGYSLKELQSIIYKTYDKFISLYPYLIPAIFLQYCDEGTIDFESDGTATSSFDMVKQFYLDAYETLGNLLVIPVALNNIQYRKDYKKCAVMDNQSKTLEGYIAFQSKAKRYSYCDDSELYTKELRVMFNSKLRNAIGHNDVEYDAISQKISYTPDPRERAKQERMYLLEFENDAIHMFQSIIVISEYLYRLNEIEMIKSGHIPLTVTS